MKTRSQVAQKPQSVQKVLLKRQTQKLKTSKKISKNKTIKKKQSQVNKSKQIKKPVKSKQKKLTQPVKYNLRSTSQAIQKQQTLKLNKNQKKLNKKQSPLRQILAYAEIKIDQKNSDEAFKRLTKLGMKTRFNKDHIPELFQLIQSEDLIEKYFGTVGFRRLICSETKKLVMKDDQYQKITQIVVKLMKQNKYPHLQIHSKDQLHFYIQKMKKLLNKSDPTSRIFKQGTWALSNLCRNNPPPDYNKLTKAVSTLNNALLHITEEDYIIDLIWAVSKLSNKNEFKAKFYEPEGVIDKLLELSSHKKYVISIPATRCVGNLLVEEEAKCQILIDKGVINILMNQLDHEKHAIRREACWALSNITAGNHSQVQSFLDSGALDKMMLNFTYDDNKVMKEAVYVINNLGIYATVQQAMTVIEKGVLKGLIEILQQSDQKTMTVGISGIYHILKIVSDHYIQVEQRDKFIEILEEHGIPQYLCQCKHTHSNQVIQKIEDILNGFFSEYFEELQEWEKVKIEDSKQHEFNSELFLF
eukprot:403369659